MAGLLLTLLSLVPLAGWLLLVGWSPSRLEGEVLLRVPVPLLARLKMLSIPIVSSLGLLLPGMAAGYLRWWVVVTVILMNVGLLAIRWSYTLTTIGIRLGPGVFRRWTEFAGVRRSRAGAELQGGPRAASYPVYLGGNRGDDEFVLTLKTLIQDSYKGKATVQERLQGGSTHPGGERSTTSSINH